MEGSFHGGLLRPILWGVISWKVAGPILWRGHFMEGC